MKRRKRKDQKPAGTRYHSPDATHPGVIDLTDQTFASVVDGHTFAIVNFWAPTSEPCCMFAPIFAAAAARNPDVLFANVNCEDQQAIGVQFDIRSIPMLMIFRDNIIVYSEAGLLQAGTLDDVLGVARALDMEEARRNVVSVDEVALGAPVESTTGARAQPAAALNNLSIETYLRPSLRGPGSALADVGARLSAGGLVAIRNAFEPDFAERMYRSLDRCTTWRVYESHEGDFHYRHHNLYQSDEYPEDMAWCTQIFDSAGTKAWVGSLSGRTCPGPAEVGASWYLPGDHSLPHNDVADSGANFSRQVAFVWHLAKDWRSEWGGALFWCPKGLYLPPAFNTLWLFNVGPESTHFVTQVSPYAQGKRLAINGWWTGPAATGSPGWSGPERISAGAAEIEIY